MGHLSIFSALLVLLGTCRAQYGGQLGEQPQGQFGAPPQEQPQGQFGAPPQEQPQGQFGAPPQEQPQGQLGAPPQEQPQGQFGAPPQGQFDGQPQGQFGAPPQGQFDGQPQGQFGAPPQGQFDGQPQGQFGEQPQGQFGGRPQTGSLQIRTSFSGIMGPRELEIQQWLGSIESQASTMCNRDSIADFDLDVNSTPENDAAFEKAQKDTRDFNKAIQKDISQRFPWWQDLQCERLWKRVRHHYQTGPGDIPDQKIEESIRLEAELLSAHSKSTVCDIKIQTNCELHLDPELTNIFNYNRDYDELAYYWTAWHDQTGKNLPAELYAKFATLKNEKAQYAGFQNYAEQSANSYNDFTPNFSFESFKGQMTEAWSILKPYYMKLHAWVRFKLTNYYGPKATHPLGLLPAHIFGNMWAQVWDNIDNITRPYPDLPAADATNAMLIAGFTVERMFQEADKFYVSLGLLPMTPLFWENSVVVAPKKESGIVRECTPSGREFCQRKPLGNNADYRIVMCAKVNQKDFSSIHHEIGKIQYYMHYAHLPIAFREGANPGFLEAIGEALEMVVSTPKHFQCVLGLDMKMGIDCNAGEGPNSDPSVADINFLYLKALNAFPTLSNAYSMEFFKFEIATGQLAPEQFNTRWWQLRAENLGIVPPSPRPVGVFDPASKFHIAADVEYSRYFWSDILKFQLFQALCVHAGEYQLNNPNTKPLYKCDFSGNQVAGRKLAKMLSLGKSRSWPDQLEQFTGSRKLDAAPMLNYFMPLFNWIDVQLQREEQKACFGADCQH